MFGRKRALKEKNSRLAIGFEPKEDITAFELACIITNNLHKALQCDFSYWDTIPDNIKRHIVVDRDPRENPYTEEDL